jgi:hypothetical protein
MTPEQHTMLDKIESARKSFNEVIIAACQTGIIGDYEFVTNIEGCRGIPQVDVSYAFVDKVPKVGKIFEA